MKWIFFAVFCAASFSAQSLPSDMSTLPPVAPVASLPPIVPRNPDGTINWSSLVRASDGLATEAEALQSDLETLQTRYDTLLSLSRVVDEEARREFGRRSLEAGLWRAGALSGMLGVAGALADAGSLQGAAIGAGFGALAGAVWWVAEYWPPWK